VLQVILVVPVGVVVRPGVRASALFARQAGDDHAFGQLEQEAELERLRQVGVEDLTLVVDDDALVALAELPHDVALGKHQLLAPEDAEVLVHRLGELVADLPWALAVAAVEQLLELALCVRLHRLRHCYGRVGHRPVRRMGADAFPVRDRFHERVAAEPVGAVDGNARRLSGRVQPLERRQAPDVRVDTAHVVVGARPHGNGLVDRVDARKRHRQLARAVQAFEDPFGSEMTEIQEHVAVEPATFVDLRLLRSGDDVARGELHRVGRVMQEEALAAGVEQVCALPAAALGDEHARRRERRRVELHHLHVLQRNAGPQRERHSVPGAGVRVRRARVEPSRAARCEDHRLGADRDETALEQVPRDHALAAIVVDDELPREVLLVRPDLSLHDLLVEDVDEDVTRDVCGVRRTGLARGAERPLCDAAVGRPREDGAPVLELVNVSGRLVAEDLDRVLVAEVVGALDGVVRVLLGIVLGRVPEGRVDAAFGRAGVASDRVDLRDHRHVRAGVERLYRCAHARAARTDDDDVVPRVHAKDAT
jgi:hypothetical protein